MQLLLQLYRPYLHSKVSRRFMHECSFQTNKSVGNACTGIVPVTALQLTNVKTYQANIELPTGGQNKWPDYVPHMYILANHTQG